MKITFILPKYSNKIIGGYKVVYQYANYLADCGHEITIIHIASFGKHKEKSSFRFLVKKTQMFFKNCQKNPKIKWFKLNNKIKLKFIQNDKQMNCIPDGDAIIATAWYSAFSVFAYPDRCGKKYYFIQHYETWSGKKHDVNSSWKLPIEKIVIAQWLVEVGARLDVSVHLVQNFVDQTEFYLETSIMNRKPKVGMLVHPSKWKGTSVGIEVIERIHSTFPDVNFIFFGVYPRISEIPSYVEYIENPSRKRLRSIYNDISIFLFPSVSEGWGLTATEAMSCGAALVATDNGGVKDFGFDKKTALIAPVNDINKLVDNISNLIINEPLRIKIAKNGNFLVNGMTLNKSGKAFERILLKGKKEK